MPSLPYFAIYHIGHLLVRKIITITKYAEVN